MNSDNHNKGFITRYGKKLIEEGKEYYADPIRRAGIAAALAGRSDSPPYSDTNLSRLWLAGYDSVVITEES